MAFAAEGGVVRSPVAIWLRLRECWQSESKSCKVFRLGSEPLGCGLTRGGPSRAAAEPSGSDMLNKPPDDTPLERHRDWLQGVAISSDNGLIVSNSADGNLQMWPMPADVGEMISSELTKNVSRMLLDHGYKPRLPTTSYVRVWKSLLTF